MKSKLKQKNNNLSYNNLCLNIQNVILEISKSFYLNLIKGAYKKQFLRSTSKDNYSKNFLRKF